MDVFSVLPERITATEIPYVGVFTPWKSTDYHKIASFFFTNVLERNIELWKIREIDATRECETKGGGLDYFYISLFQESEISNRPYRVVHGLSINPRDNELADTKKEYKDPIGQWQSINPQNQKLTAEMAFSIAKKKGGEKYRAKYANNCRVLIDYRAFEENGNSWNVTYTTMDNNKPEEFEIVIDAENGEFNIVTK